MSRFSFSGRALPSNMWLLNRFGLPGRPSPLGLLHERDHERVQLVRLAMVGVQRHVDRVALGDAVDVLGDRDGAERHVLHRGARGERGAAGRDLDDPVAPALGQPLQDGVGGGERGDVDGGIGELSLPRPIEHLAVPGMVGYRHETSVVSNGRDNRVSSIGPPGAYAIRSEARKL